MNKMATILACAMALAAGAGARGETIGGAFKGSDPGVYLSNATAMYEDAALVDAPDLEGVVVMRLRYDSELPAEFHSIPVKPDHVYTLRLKAKWENRETIETNPIFGMALRELWETALSATPTIVVEFLDESRKPLKNRLVSAFPYASWREHQRTFFPPAGASYMRLSVRVGLNDGTLYLTGPVFEATPVSAEERILTFRHEDDNLSGRTFGILLDGMSYRHQEDYGIATGPGQRSDVFSLSEPGAYRLTIKGQPLGASHSAVLRLFDETGARTGDINATHSIGTPLEFTLPEKTTDAQFLIDNLVLDEIRIDRVR